MAGTACDRPGFSCWFLLHRVLYHSRPTRGLGVPFRCFLSPPTALTDAPVFVQKVAFAFGAGLVVIAAMVPLNAALARRIGAATRELMGHKDDRVQRCSEMLHGIRVRGAARVRAHDVRAHRKQQVE